MQYEDKLVKATLLKLSLDNLKEICKEVYELTPEMRKKIHYEPTFKLLGIWKEVNNEKEKQFIAINIEALKEAKSPYHPHYLILKDLMNRGYIPEGMYVITP